jgi:uncharacterized SAM-binding protein YcdF (DUF218 family)
MRSRIKTIALWLLLAGIIWCGVLATLIWHYGSQDHAAKSDCTIILGAAVQGAAPSPVFEERIRHGIDLYQAGLAPKLLFTGGVGEGQKLSESSVGRSIAAQQSVPVGDDFDRRPVSNHSTELVRGAVRDAESRSEVGNHRQRSSSHEEGDDEG